MDSDAASLAGLDALTGRVTAGSGTLDVLFVNTGLTRFVPSGSMTGQMYDEHSMARTLPTGAPVAPGVSC